MVPRIKFWMTPGTMRKAIIVRGSHHFSSTNINQISNNTGLRVGEVLNNKYRVFAGHGKGVFSTVLSAKTIAKGEDGEEGEEVAIKVIRNKEVM